MRKTLCSALTLSVLFGCGAQSGIVGEKTEEQTTHAGASDKADSGAAEIPTDVPGSTSEELRDCYLRTSIVCRDSEGMMNEACLEEIRSDCNEVHLGNGLNDTKSAESAPDASKTTAIEPDNSQSVAIVPDNGPSTAVVPDNSQSAAIEPDLRELKDCYLRTIRECQVDQDTMDTLCVEAVTNECDATAIADEPNGDSLDSETRRACYASTLEECLDSEDKLNPACVETGLSECDKQLEPGVLKLNDSTTNADSDSNGDELEACYERALATCRNSEGTPDEACQRAELSECNDLLMPGVLELNDSTIEGSRSELESCYELALTGCIDSDGMMDGACGLAALDECNSDAANDSAMSAG